MNTIQTDTGYPSVLRADRSQMITVTGFGVLPNSDVDATFGVLQALDSCRAAKNPVLVFPKGTYHFYPNKAAEKYYAISNNWHKLQRVALPLWNFDGITVDGQGSDFIMHGMTLPFVLEGSRRVTLKNLSIIGNTFL